jgi:gliding motility-associated-like protein
VKVSDGNKTSALFNLKINVSGGGTDIAPVITGQQSLSTVVNQPFTILLSHLQVSDPDDSYPSGFTLQILPGENYAFQSTTVMPAQDFTGDLAVRVSVHDGTLESQIYALKVSVKPATNKKPVITGQAGLKIIEGRTLEIKLSYLTVLDEDNQYPQDFTLQILAGESYTVASNIITSLSGFLGNLHVKLTVSDGTDNSDPFDLVVQVVPQNKFEILGQKTLEIEEDSSIVIQLTDLVVSDPSDSYPQGYTLQVSPGKNYKVNQTSIRPDENFNGNTTVPIKVIKPGYAEASFSLLVVVKSANDPPVMTQLDTDPLVASGAGPWFPAPAVKIDDVDDDELLYAEIGFDSVGFRSSTDELLFENSEHIHGVYDGITGVLFLLGTASHDEYQQVARSVGYGLKNPGDTVQQPQKKIYFKFSDGKDMSATYVRLIVVETDLSLDIPTAFTPNNDNANDTWKIIPLARVEELNAVIRVYNTKGVLVFEGTSLETEWDGSFNGSPLPADVYFYTIEMDLSQRKMNYKGMVSILR